MDIPRFPESWWSAVVYNQAARIGVVNNVSYFTTNLNGLGIDSSESTPHNGDLLCAAVLACAGPGDSPEFRTEALAQYPPQIENLTTLLSTLSVSDRALTRFAQGEGMLNVYTLSRNCQRAGLDVSAEKFGFLSRFRLPVAVVDIRTNPWKGHNTARLYSPAIMSPVRALRLMQDNLQNRGPHQ